MTTNIQAIEWKPKANRWLITTAVMLATFVSALNTSIANVALKQIAGSFSASQDESLWIVTSFLVASSVLLPAVAWFCTLMGRKKFLLICLCVFCISSFFCGISQNMTMMLFFRVLQGLGGGVLFPISQAILFETFPKEEHGLAMSIFGLGVVFAPIIGPLLGGWLTTNYSWNWVFFVSIPFCVTAFIMINIYLEDPPYMRAQGMQKIDFIGFFLLIVWLFSFQTMLDNGQKNGWFGSTYIARLGIIALVSFLSLIWWELKNKNPLVDLKIFKNWNFTIGTFVYTATFIILYGAMAIMPLFTQSLLGYTSYLSGLAVASMGFGNLGGIIFTAIFSDRIDARKVMAVGLLLCATGCLMFGNLNANIALKSTFLPNLIIGMSFPLIITSLMTLIFANVENKDMTNASGVQNLLKNVGGAIGTTMVGVLVSRYAQVFQHNMVHNLTPLSEVYATKLQMLVAAFSKMTDGVSATQMAHALMYSNLVKQSVLCAYMQSYKTYALIAIILIPSVFILKKVTHKK